MSEKCQCGNTDCPSCMFPEMEEQTSSASDDAAYSSAWVDIPNRAGWWIVAFATGKMYALQVRRVSGLYYKIKCPEGGWMPANRINGKCRGPFRSESAARKGSLSNENCPSVGATEKANDNP